MDENFNNQQNNQQNNQYGQQNPYNQQNNQYGQQNTYNQQNNQYGQQYQQPNNYNGYNNYTPNQYQQPQQDNSKGLAIASLVLGIVSFFCCGSVCSIVGIVLGVLSRNKKPTDNGMATAGIVLSIVALALWAIYFIYMIVVYGSFSAAYNSYRYY